MTTTTEPRVTTPENDARAAAGWKISASQREDNRRGKRYARSVEIHVPIASLAGYDRTKDRGGHSTFAFDGIIGGLKLALAASPLRPRPSLTHAEVARPVTAVHMGLGWHKTELVAHFTLMADSPKQIPTEAEAVTYAWSTAAPALADLLAAEIAAASERARRERARHQAEVIERWLVDRIEKAAHRNVNVDKRLAALVAEAQAEARRLATLALAPGGDASEDELDAFSDGTVIEPEARAYVRRVLVEACAQGAAEVGHPWLPSRDEVTEAEVFASGGES
jgi:hypothetical protein